MWQIIIVNCARVYSHFRSRADERLGLISSFIAADEQRDGLPRDSMLLHTATTTRLRERRHTTRFIPHLRIRLEWNHDFASSSLPPFFGSKHDRVGKAKMPTGASVKRQYSKKTFVRRRKHGKITRLYLTRMLFVLRSIYGNYQY